MVTGEFSGSYNIFQLDKNEAEFIEFGEMQRKQCLEENLMHNLLILEKRKSLKSVTEVAKL